MGYGERLYRVLGGEQEKTSSKSNLIKATQWGLATLQNRYKSRICNSSNLELSKSDTTLSFCCFQTDSTLLRLSGLQTLHSQTLSNSNCLALQLDSTPFKLKLRSFKYGPGINFIQNQMSFIIIINAIHNRLLLRLSKLQLNTFHKIWDSRQYHCLSKSP